MHGILLRGRPFFLLPYIRRPLFFFSRKFRHQPYFLFLRQNRQRFGKPVILPRSYSDGSHTDCDFRSSLPVRSEHGGGIIFRHIQDFHRHTRFFTGPALFVLNGNAKTAGSGVSRRIVVIHRRPVPPQALLLSICAEITEGPAVNQYGPAGRCCKPSFIEHLLGFTCAKEIP